MRAFVPTFEMQTPASLNEALKILDSYPGEWKPFAGGTDLMVLFEAGKLTHKKYLNLLKLKELHGISVSKETIRIGALTTYSEILHHPVLQQEFPMLCTAASLTGAVAIQNRGTIGGNLANASPAADTPPALLAYGATIELQSIAGTRAVRDFHLGYKKTALKPNELIAGVLLKRRSHGEKFDIHHYRKVGTRKAQAISKVCLAAVARRKGGKIVEISLGWGSVAPTPFRSVQTEEAVLQGKEAGTVLAKEITPIDDIRSTSDYRLKVAQNLLREFLSKC